MFMLITIRHYHYTRNCFDMDRTQHEKDRSGKKKKFYCINQNLFLFVTQNPLETLSSSSSATLHR